MSMSSGGAHQQCALCSVFKTNDLFHKIAELRLLKPVNI